jgi:hypothetical protein
MSVCLSICLSVYPFVCLCPSFTNKELLRKDTAFLVKQKSVEIRERFVHLSYFKTCVCVSLSVCLLALFYQVRAQKGHLVLGQTEVRGDTREVCTFVLL